MSCPDWNALTAHRRQRPRSWHRDAEEPAGWSAALAHSDTCESCRREALRADPTLVFRRLPAVSTASTASTVSVASITAAEERGEAEAVRQAVAALRAARRLGSPEARPRTLTGWTAGWRRWTAAAVLALAALSLGSDDPGRRQTAGRGEIFHEGARIAAGDLLPVERLAGADAPTVEGVDRPGARVYQMSGEGLSVVMVVDETLDL